MSVDITFSQYPFFSSNFRYLREQKYLYSIVRDKEFSTSRQVLGSKSKELKGKGKGNRQNRAEPLTFEERVDLRTKGLTGTEKKP